MHGGSALLQSDAGAAAALHEVHCDGLGGGVLKQERWFQVNAGQVPSQRRT